MYLRIIFSRSTKIKIRLIDKKKLTWDSNNVKQRRKMTLQQSFNLKKADDVTITIQKEKNDQIMDKDFCPKINRKLHSAIIQEQR